MSDTKVATIVAGMRLVSWNICDGFKRKFGHLERLHPDIAVIQEVRPECLRYAGLHERSVWIGDPNQKGLAIISYGNWKITPVPLDIAERWFLPIVATNGTTRLHLLAVWVAASAQGYGAPTLRAVRQAGAFLGEAPSIIAGDFNGSIAIKNKIEAKAFADVLDVLVSYRMTSAWHARHNEPHGKETSPTLYWTWNAEKRFHIDFVFGSSDLTATEVSLGTYDQYVGGRISDHVPLIVDYAFSFNSEREHQYKALR